MILGGAGVLVTLNGTITNLQQLIVSGGAQVVIGHTIPQFSSLVVGQFSTISAVCFPLLVFYILFSLYFIYFYSFD
jgi:hypothetical protein